METAKKVSKKAQKQAQIDAKIAPRTDTTNIYEIGFILVPSISEDRARVEEKAIADAFTQKGGELISSEPAVLIDLAYPMLKVIHAHREKCFEGYFGWMKFEIETEMIADVKKYLDGSETMLRYLLIKTVRENTMVNGKMNLAKETGRDALKKDIQDGEDVVGEEVAPASPEELDKSIDDLVIA